MNKKINNWNQKTVWIIGASTGIGRATAELMLKLGSRVIISARNEEALKQIYNLYPKNAVVRALDVTDFSKIKLVADEFNQVDLIIYMAADYSPIHSSHIDHEIASRIIDINFKGAVNVASAVIPHMVSRKEGHLCFVASIAGLVGLPSSSIYGSTKAAIINFVESLYFDLKPLGVDISMINPGFVKTRLTDKNEFNMPLIMTPEMAAEHIVSGFEQGKFANIFPISFSLLFRFLRILPYRLHFFLMRKIIKL